MAYTTIDKSTLFQNNVLYNGDGTAIGSGGNVITGVGFSADMTWLKERSSTSGHHLFDTARGATKKITPDSTAASPVTLNRKNKVCQLNVLTTYPPMIEPSTLPTPTALINPPRARPPFFLPKIETIRAIEVP